jgi:mono/diheme cytochrome c family protein
MRLPAATALALTAFALTSGSCRRKSREATAPPPVEGPSWLRQRGLDLDRTPLGKLGGRAGPPASARSEPDPARGPVLFHLTGADMYRLSCQSCHGPTGVGAAPEIGSIVGAVSATSAAELERRAADAGHPIAREMAEQLAADARASLERRLATGGEKMPAFDYLTAAERAALLGYLQRLAGSRAGPEATPAPVPASSDRAGELLLRGTCHLCHDASGLGNPHRTMMAGEIPSLASLPRGWPLGAVIEKVRTGRRPGMGGMMGGGGMMGRAARMPAYPYLTPQEIAAAYLALRASE